MAVCKYYKDICSQATPAADFGGGPEPFCSHGFGHGMIEGPCPSPSWPYVLDAVTAHVKKCLNPTGTCPIKNSAANIARANLERTHLSDEVCPEIIGADGKIKPGVLDDVDPSKLRAGKHIGVPGLTMLAPDVMKVVRRPAGAKQCDKYTQCIKKPTSVDGRVVCNHGEKHGPVPNPELHDIKFKSGTKKFECANPDGTCPIKENIREKLREMLQINHADGEACDQLLRPDLSVDHTDANCAHLLGITLGHGEAYKIALDASRAERRKLRRNR